ncbi:hypothetical protein CPC08DRAFT_464841 [Agrocybe pediades]|nr:hypothetical protein CPC08DRAFT_464841 [Agrocybe pediades]
MRRLHFDAIPHLSATCYEVPFQCLCGMCTYVFFYLERGVWTSTRSLGTWLSTLSSTVQRILSSRSNWGSACCGISITLSYITAYAFPGFFFPFFISQVKSSSPSSLFFLALPSSLCYGFKLSLILLFASCVRNAQKSVAIF